jgi:hypothetical protein
MQGGGMGMIGGLTDAAFDETASRDLGDWGKNMLGAGAKGLASGAIGGGLRVGVERPRRRRDRRTRSASR